MGQAGASGQAPCAHAGLSVRDTHQLTQTHTLSDAEMLPEATVTRSRSSVQLRKGRPSSARIVRT